MTLDAHTADATEGRSVQAAVSNEMVRLYKEQFGRGPTKVRTNYAGPDTLIATIQNSLTPAEHNLLKMGEEQRLRETRMLFQHAIEDQFRGAVETITGRKVWAFVSGMDAREDVSIEVFYLEPGTDASQGDAPIPVGAVTTG